MALRPLLLDTNAYSAFKSGDPEALEIISHAPLIGLDTIVLGELLGGFIGGNREAWNRQQLKEFLSSSRAQQFPVDDRTAEHYAAIYDLLKAQGPPHSYQRHVDRRLCSSARPRSLYPRWPFPVHRRSCRR